MNTNVEVQTDVPPSPSWGSIFGGIGLAIALVLVVTLLFERFGGKK